MRELRIQEGVRFAIRLRCARGCKIARTLKQVYRFLLLTLTREMLLVAVALCLTLAKHRAEDLIVPCKCCGVNEALNGYASACVTAPWPQYHIDYKPRGYVMYTNESWLRRWLPPGVPLGVIEYVDIEQMYRFLGNGTSAHPVTTLRVPVRTSGLAEEAKGDDWRPDHAVFDHHHVVRRGPDGSTRRGAYCVDAALDPFPTSFALLMVPYCFNNHDCVQTCCLSGDVLIEAADGSWSCARNNWLNQSSVAELKRIFDPEIPLAVGAMVDPKQLQGGRDLRQQCPKGRNHSHRLSTDAPAHALMIWHTDDFFSTTLTCVSYIARADSTVEFVAAHCNFPRWSRAFYWCTRPLSFVSVLLLLAAEASIVSSPRLRSSVHGWALACHAGCLLAFNILQVAFYLSVSDDADSDIWETRNTAITCTALALPIYFCLTAASCWLTAICVNMNTGFKATRVARTGRRKRRFLMLSAFAWGIPVILTVACGTLFLEGKGNPFQPTMMETRTCFDEIGLKKKEGSETLYEVKSKKEGSALFYYAPMAVLSVVNVICVIRTMLRVRFLAHGNSVLRRGTRQRYKTGDREEQASCKLRIRQKKTQRVGSPYGPKSVSVYIKLLLSAGVLELTAETTAWVCSTSAAGDGNSWLDDTEPIEKLFSYRAVGYLTDFLRAAIVLWLATPQAGDLRSFCCRLRRSCRGPKWLSTSKMAVSVLTK